MNMMERLAYSDDIDTSQMSTADKLITTAVPLASGVIGAGLGARWKMKSFKPDMPTEHQGMELAHSVRLQGLGVAGLVGGAVATSPLRPKKKKEDLEKAAYRLSEAMERYAGSKREPADPVEEKYKAKLARVLERRGEGESSARE